MLEHAEYIKFFAALLAIVNPLGTIPIFLDLTLHQSTPLRRKTGSMATWTCALLLLFVLISGEFLLQVFGITIDSFRVAGGLLILLMAISMMQAHMSEVKQTPDEAQEATLKEQVGVIPLGIPLLAGPGAISTVILYTHRGHGLLHLLVLSLITLIVSFLVWLSFYMAPLAVKVLGQTGINIFTRMMGLIMAAVGIEFITNGLKQLFPGLI
ncbi:MAG: YchE family NAAT transporter [Gammaproteobacteria bacterium]|nr:YchE family NAAT transporter [Gammaproteobacteria bacterium]